MTKTAALKQNALVVQSPRKPPAPKREYYDFDAYAEAARMLRMRSDQIFGSGDERSPRRRDLPFDRPVVDDLDHWYAKFDAGREHYEREELYSTTKTRGDLLGVCGMPELTRRVITEKIGLLIGSFPNSSPHDAETYMGMLTEEVFAANPRASALEATCRDLRRTQKFAPAIAEVLATLRKQAETWSEVLYIRDDDIAYWKETVAAMRKGESESDDDA